MTSDSLPPRTIDYQVAWMSAIAKEYTIACALLDEEYDPPSDLPEDDSCYTFGRMGDHNVVMARLPPARIGLSSAGNLATDIVRTFPALKFGLLVGIAGGAPTKEHDIRLGDVVVSLPNDRKRLGGVVHYAFGRTVQGVDFERTGALNAPPKLLLNAVAKLRANHERKGIHLIETVNEAIAKNAPRLDDFKRPDSCQDMLYEASFVHVDETQHCMSLCNDYTGALVPRTQRDSTQKQPHVHYGVVGSADILVRDAMLRDQIAQRDGVLCFEMEAAGLMNTDFRCLVIRGICDYSDSHKNDEWQNYAAAVAAAYGKDLLSVIRPRKVVQEGILFNQRSSTLIAFTNPGVLKLLSYENMNDKHDYSMPEVSFNHDWVWSTSFHRWLSMSNQPYWICGKPGSGKSTLMAYLVHDRRTLTQLQSYGTSYKILHFFYDCRAGTGLANNVQGMLRMFVYQLADHFKSVLKRLEELQSEGRFKIDTVQDLMTLACEALTAPSSELCIFIDGLDEYEGDLFELAHTIRLLKERTGVKLCVASRPEARVAEVFQLYDMILMQDYNQASMYEYAIEEIARASTTKLDLMSKFTKPLQAELVEKAEGIILWFKLALDEVLLNYVPGLSKEQIRQSIEDIPQGLDAMYERILGLIPPAYRHEAALLLFLVQELRGMSEEVHELSDADDLSTIVFSTTDMDHLWGAYDFLVDEIGEDIGLERLNNSKELQGRIKLLLGGLIEVYEVEPDKSLTRGTTNLDVRYLHKTLYSWIRKTDWIGQHLSSQVLHQYPDPFRLSFLSRMIEQAAKEEFITRQHIDACVEDAQLLVDLANFKGSAVAGRVKRFVTGRRSTLAGLVKEFGVYGVSAPPSKIQQFIDNSLDWLIEFASTDFDFPKKWKTRHVILRTALLNLLDLASKYERGERSCFFLIANALQSHLNAVTGFHFFICPLYAEASSLHESLLEPILKHAELREVWDLSLAIVRTLPGYFNDRIFSSAPLSTRQKDFLVKTLLTRCFDLAKKHSVSRFVHMLLANECFINPSHVCFFLTHSTRLSVAGYRTKALRPLLPPKADFNDQSSYCSCQHNGQAVGLLFHWAQLSADDCFQPLKESSSIKEHRKILDFILEFGIDLNAPCYSGGSVLHAILDDSVHPLPGRQELQRKVKFLVLMKYGINPRTTGKQGTALEAVNKFKRKLSKWDYGILPCLRPDLTELDFITRYLEFYEANNTWPDEYDSDSSDESSNGDAELSEDEETTETMQNDMIAIEPHPVESDELTLIDDQASHQNESPRDEESEFSSHQPMKQCDIVGMNLENLSLVESKDDNIALIEKSQKVVANELVSLQMSVLTDDLFFDAQDTWTSDVEVESSNLEQVQASQETSGPSDRALEVTMHNLESSSTTAAEVSSRSDLIQRKDDVLASVEVDEVPGNPDVIESIRDTDGRWPPFSDEELQQLWDEQLSRFSVDWDEVPSKLRKVFDYRQANAWLFTLRLLSMLGLEVTRDVKNTTTFVLQELDFWKIRTAVYGILNAMSRQDLIENFHDIEIAQFLSLDLPQLPEQSSLTFAQATEQAQDSVSFKMSGSASQQSRSVDQNTLVTAQEAASGEQSGVLDVDLFRNIKEKLASHCDTSKLKHRSHMDPAKRRNLLSKSTSEKKTKLSKDHFDRLLVEDFRWMIIECLGYGHEVAPSRRISYDFLRDAKWDFDLAVANYVCSLGEGRKDDVIIAT